MNSAFEKIACSCLLVQFHEERNELILLVFFFFASGAKIDWVDIRGMIEGSIDKFIARDYFFFSRVEQFCIPRFERNFNITMEH